MCKGKKNPEFNNAMEIPMEVVRLGSIPYENTLYGYFIGRTLPFRQVCYHVEKMWSIYGLKKVTTNGNGYFFFKFGDKNGLNQVIEDGPWIIQNVPIFVNRWEVVLTLSKHNHTNVPLWVKIHNIPCELLTGQGINYVASSLGKPISMDAYTSEMCNGGTSNMKYARVLIEFSANVAQQDTVRIVIPKLDGSGEVLHEMNVVYPWRPSMCETCNVYGHDAKHCPRSLATTQTANKGNQEASKQQPKVVDDEGFQTIPRKNHKPMSNTTKTNQNQLPNQTKEFHPKPKPTQNPKNTRKPFTSTSSKSSHLNKPKPKTFTFKPVPNRTNTNPLKQNKNQSVEQIQFPGGFRCYGDVILE